MATRLGQGQSQHATPEFLPGGRQFLFTSAGSAFELWLGTLDGSESRRVAGLTLGADSTGEYVPPGWLMRVRQNVITAQRFDAVSGHLSGGSVTVAQEARIDQGNYSKPFSVAASGSGSSFRTIAW